MSSRRPPTKRRANESSRERRGSAPVADPLELDARDLHQALSTLVRVYQFRDRQRICFYDVSVTQCYAIGALVGHGALRLSDLAATLHLDKSTASRLADSLVDRGYVVRTPDPTDARAVLLSVSEAGRELHERIERDIIDEVKLLVSGFDSDVRQATTRLIARLARAAATRYLDDPGDA